ncbi:Hypothetical protein Minf_2343 [Methylacidiphilum infernorum V4]|uniref:Uncharacterized protein n=1 Tax=Methylacidiphilum infernorum (isolate V4) TaxID=481448 RepID=B3E0G8_METI4|nr:Hypothetical protein Minf_2343 [Methylacidiphilum infernorum V4]
MDRLEVVNIEAKKEGKRDTKELGEPIASLGKEL